MKKLFLSAAAAACLLAAPTLVSPASAASSYDVAQVELNIGTGHRHRDHDKVIIKERHHRHCKNVTVRSHRPNGTVVVKHERRCR